MDDLLKKIEPPYDWENPDWDSIGKCHDWKNYAGDFNPTFEYFDEIINPKDFWNELTAREKKLISSMCDDRASNEQWD